MDQTGTEQKTPSSAENKETLQKALSGGHWYLINMVIQRILTIGTFFITARLLTPADFGIIAIAGIYPAFIDALTALSFETALVQKESGKEKEYLNIVWTFSILRAIALFGLVFISAPFVAKFFNAEAYLTLFRLGGFVFVLQSLGNVGSIYFFRDLDFKKVFLRDLFLSVTNAFATIVLALIFHSYWALFIGSLSGFTAATISTYFLNSYRPRVDLGLRKLKELWAYSQWIFGQNILNQSAKTIEDTLVGHFAPLADVGLLSKGKALSHVVTSPIASIIGKVGFPALSRVQNSPEHAREGIYKSLDILISISVPFLAAILIAGHRLIDLLLGAQWAGMYPLLLILTLASTLDTVVIALATPTFNALGKPKFTFAVNALYLITLIACLPFLVPTLGAYGAAISLLAASILGSIITLILIDNLIKPQWKRILETLTVVTVALVLPVLLCGYLLRFSFFFTTAGFLLLGAFIAVCYVALVAFLGARYGKGPYSTYLVILNSLFRANIFTRIHNFF